MRNNDREISQFDEISHSFHREISGLHYLMTRARIGC